MKEEANFTTTLPWRPVVPVRLIVRNFGALRRTCLLDARDTDSLRCQNCRKSMLCRPQLAGVELGKTGECNGEIHLISLEDARRANGTIDLSKTAPLEFPGVPVERAPTTGTVGVAMSSGCTSSEHPPRRHVAHQWSPQERMDNSVEGRLSLGVRDQRIDGWCSGWHSGAHHTPRAVL